MNWIKRKRGAVIDLWGGLCFISFLLNSLITVAQTTATLSGLVIDATTNSPMPFANVYLNNSTHGTISDDKGHFNLTNVPLGTVNVVASFVGYQTNLQTLRLINAQNQFITFRLKPSAETLAGVTVKASRNEKKWQQQLRQFKQQLVGKPFDNQCVLVNPEVLRFTEENGHLKATATEPLVIDNEALGYRLWFDLAYFDGEAKQVHYGGSARFEELKATNERQENRFRRNRMRAYLGSTRHLMASLISGTYEQEGFLVYEEDTKVPMPLPGDTVTLKRAIGHRLLSLNLKSLVRSGQLPFERRLVSERPLVVFYTKAKSLYSPYTDARFAYTQITFPNGPVQLLTDGWITVPNGVEMQGSLADDRLSTLLPADWKPTQTDAPSDPPVLSDAQSLSERMARYTSEKAYLHTDRSQYVAGDTLWFNAYLVDSRFHTPNVLSQTLYVNLLDATGQLMASRLLHIDSTGHDPGAITLPDSLPSGTYQLLAYTNWMRNADTDFLFRKRVRIDASKPKLDESMTNESKGFSLRVFPEGGQLVEGLPGRVAFQALDNLGHSLRVTGVLMNQKGDTLTDFRSLHRGMGTFSFSPQPGQHYRAVASSADGQLTAVDLPDAQPVGYQLAVDNLTNPRSVRVLIRTNQPQLDQLTLFAHMRGQIVYQAEVDANKTEMLLAISYESIPQDGILHLTLFDANNEPVAERLVFINQNRQLGIHMEVDKDSYQPREPVSLTVSTTDPSGKPLAAHLSLAITDVKQDLVVESGTATLRSYLLLASDLRGHIEAPEFYFDSTQAHVRQYLDYVMLTHGWRRFNWREVLSDSAKHPVFEVEKGLSVRGQVHYGDDNKLAREAKLTGMFKTGQNLLPMDISTDKEGGFSMENLLFLDTATVIVRHRTNRPIKLTFNDLTVPDFVLFPSLIIRGETDRQAVINQALEMQLVTKRLQQNGGKLLQTVNVKARRLDASRNDYRRQMYEVADETIVATDQIRSVPTVFMMVTGQAAGVGIGKDLHGNQAFTLRGGPALALVDGVMVSNAILPTISPADIEAIDVLKNPATYGIFGSSAQYGVINILTRRGPGEGKKINQVISKIIGYAVSREFYSPRYAHETMTNNPDYRATLYWNPSVQTDANGKATVTFYNTDNPTTIRAVAEGITPAGQPGYGTLNYSVKK